MIIKYLDNIINFQIEIIGVLDRFNKELITSSLTLGIFSTLIYLYIFPLMGNSKLGLNPKVFGAGISKKSKEYVVLSILLSYLSIGIILFLIYYNFNFDKYIIAVLKYYDAIPIIISSAFILMVIIVRFIIIPVSSLIDRDKNNHSTCEITIRLLELLKTTNEVKNIHILENKKRVNIINKIEKIASLIELYSFGFGNVSVSNSFRNSAAYFRGLSNSFIMPKKDSLDYCQNEIIKYCNCFLSGDIDSLPRDENVKTEEIKKQKSKLLSLISIIIYLLLPILIYFIIDHFVKIELSDFEQSMFKLSYVIWSVIGITTNHTIFNNETKDLLKDVIKTIINK